MIKLYYAYTDILTPGLIESLGRSLPVQLKAKLDRYKREAERHNMLISLALLQAALTDNDHCNYKLENILYSETGRPYFAGSNFDFNISHTENCAAVAFADDCRVGIDIEKIKDTDLSDFTGHFSPEVWENICTANQQLERFYFYWTLVESGVKADGGGLSLISEKKVILNANRLFIKDTEWFYNHYNFDNSISCCITSDKKDALLFVKKITTL